ncbi:MAG: MarR family winged helix-turn-helix transcriptional regulator [Paracoccus sp. (in: a-proteobacteria)]|nr:MarR family winged helix-turn-helix transcriptional regulator [Paracoccus sp. (in: a-proteobacteria)]
MRDAPIFRLEKFLPFRVNRVADNLVREIGGVYREMYGMSRGEWRVLAHLGANGSNTASNLMALTALDKVKISRAVTALGARGWLSRDVDRADRRVYHLSLTEAGRAAFARLAPAMQARQQDLFEGLDAERYARIEAALQDLEAVLHIEMPER